ncbi:MAG: hypothetical protein KDJ25_06185 [Rhodoblastus sp.]|nr:hypothetical protein [Rhodoblastus sp.]
MTVTCTRAGALQLFGLAIFAGVGVFARSAHAADGVKLFKIVSARDEIVVGVTDKELSGEGSDLARLTAKMRAAGQLEVWRYAVRKSASGDLEQAPATRVMIIFSDTLRIEPYRTPLKVLPPA